MTENRFEEKAQVAAYRLLLAERGVIQISAEERRELARYGLEWLARHKNDPELQKEKGSEPPDSLEG